MCVTVLYVFKQHWPVEVLRQFDALVCLQVAEAAQEASVGVKGRL